MSFDNHVIDKALSVYMIIIYKKYKQQTVIQLNENHCPNTVYLSGIGQPIKKICIAVLNLLSNNPSWNDIPN